MEGGAGRPRDPAGKARTQAPVRTTDGAAWHARYIDLGGRRRRKGRYPTKRAAREAGEALIEDLNAGFGRSEVTLTQWHERWPKRFGRAPRTVATHSHRMKKYVLPHLPAQGAIPLHAVTRANARDVQTALLNAGHSKGHVDDVVSSFSAVLGYALEDDLIDHNPAYRMRVDPADPRLAPESPRRAPRYVPPEQVGALLAHIHPAWGAVPLVVVATGVRTQEVFALRVQDIDREQELILVHQRAQQHGGSADGLIPGLKVPRGLADRSPEERGRHTIFPGALWEQCGLTGLSASLELVRRRRKSGGLLFPTQSGKVWGQQNFGGRVMAPTALKAGVDITLKDLRHTFASALSAAGIPLVEIAGYMGHSTRQQGGLDNTTTRVYAHPTGESRNAALKAISAYLASAQSTAAEIISRLSVPVAR